VFQNVVFSGMWQHKGFQISPLGYQRLQKCHETCSAHAYSVNMAHFVLSKHMFPWIQPTKNFSNMSTRATRGFKSDVEYVVFVHVGPDVG